MKCQTLLASRWGTSVPLYSRVYRSSPGRRQCLRVSASADGSGLNSKSFSPVGKTFPMQNTRNNLVIPFALKSVLSSCANSVLIHSLTATTFEAPSTLDSGAFTSSGYFRLLLVSLLLYLGILHMVKKNFRAPKNRHRHSTRHSPACDSSPGRCSGLCHQSGARSPKGVLCI